MIGYHDLVRGKQSSLLTFWEGAWTLSLCWWTGPCIWAFWPKYWQSAAWHDWPYLFCVEPQQTYMAGRDRCDPCLNWLPCLSHIHRQYCIHLVFLRLGHPWWVKEGWRTTFTGGPLSSILCLDSTLLMSLKVVPGKGENATWQWDCTRLIQSLGNQSV